MNDSEKTTGSLALKPKPRIITIPATGQDLTRPLRVAAYARVSSDSNDQLHSYAAQTAYFAKLINSNPNWIFADIYADQGITGTSVEKRNDFLRMMEDCRSGRIDRILVKSTSRFARNTKESLEAVRELKSLLRGAEHRYRTSYWRSPHRSILRPRAKRERSHLRADASQLSDADAARHLLYPLRPLRLPAGR